MKKKEYYSIGIMSGTSMDGFDFSFIKSDGESEIKILKNQFFLLDNEIKSKLKILIGELNKNFHKTIKSELFFNTEKEFSELLILNIKKFIRSNFIDPDVIDVIGVHGVTLIHIPQNKISIQIGNAQFISDNLGKKVISEFRINDLYNGGQGAPLVPVYHNAIFSSKKKTILVINIGGISNYTLLRKNKIFSSDIGPGNVLIDNFCKKYFNKNFDDKGMLAVTGNVDLDLINSWKKKKFLKIKHPISFDNFFFKLNEFVNPELDLNDNLRSLTFFTAYIISELKTKLRCKIDEWIISGGGVKNDILMSDLRELISKKRVFPSEKLGFSSDFIESQAFAFISIRTVRGLDSAFPETTGCRKSNKCGTIFNPKN